MGLKKQTEIHILIWEFENLVGGFDFQFQNFLNLVRGGGGGRNFSVCLCDKDKVPFQKSNFYIT